MIEYYAKKLMPYLFVALAIAILLKLWTAWELYRALKGLVIYVS